jgi:hypothetical protein
MANAAVRAFKGAVRAQNVPATPAALPPAETDSTIIVNGGWGAE